MSENPANGRAVGYGNPPAHTRFRKGQSGNPAGRPRNNNNGMRALERALAAPANLPYGGTGTLLDRIMQLLVYRAEGDRSHMALLFSELRHKNRIEDEAAALAEAMLAEMEEAESEADGEDADSGEAGEAGESD